MKYPSPWLSLWQIHRLNGEASIFWSQNSTVFQNVLYNLAKIFKIFEDVHYISCTQIKLFWAELIFLAFESLT